jgi:hypothetical protein
VLAFLVPSKITSAGYGEPARQSLVRETTLEYVYRVPEEESEQFGATTYPLALIVRRQAPEPRHRVQLDFGHDVSMRQTALRQAGPWILRPDHDLRALGDFLRSAEPLSTLTQSALGVKTGADSVFVGDPVQRRGKLTLVQFAHAEAWIEGRVLRRAIRGRDVRAFDFSSSKILIWACDRSGAPTPRIPELAHAYLAAHASVLRARADYREGPLWTVFRTKAACGTHRVVWPDLARTVRAVYLEADTRESVLPLNTCYCATVSSANVAHRVAAVLNSTWVIPFIRSASDEARGGYRRLNARVMDRIPIPNDPKRCAAILRASKRAHTERRANQEELDEAVAEALGLATSTRARLRRMAAAERR